MDRRQFIKGVCSVIAAVVLPIPKIATKAIKRTVLFPYNTTLTLLELAKRHNNTHLSDIAEVLNESNEILKDAVWKESNG